MAKYADMPSTEFRVQHGALGVRVSAIVRFAEDELKSPCNFFIIFLIFFFYRSSESQQSKNQFECILPYVTANFCRTKMLHCFDLRPCMKNPQTERKKSSASSQLVNSTKGA